VSEAATCLREMDMESLPLVDGKGAFSGWISFPDVQRYMVAPSRGLRRTGELVGERNRPLRNPVAPLANRSNLTVSPETKLHDAIGLLCQKQLNELTVVDKDIVFGHLSIMRILGLKMPAPDLVVQTAGLEREDPLDVSQVVGNLRSTALKIKRICRNMGTPEIKVKSYEHVGSGRRRYEVRVTFSVPEQYVAEAGGWDLVAVSNKAIGKVEKEILRQRSRIIDSRRTRRARSRGWVD
jgi:CBS domain-containing protein